MTEQQHPLTDDIIEENFTPEYGYIETDSILGVSEINLGFSCNDLRAAYDIGAADKLEQVIEWLNEAIFEQSTCFGIESLPEELEKAMRPQQQQQQENN